jgi:soluble lytic murein transglycosylase-like protein
MNTHREPVSYAGARSGGFRWGWGLLLVLLVAASGVVGYLWPQEARALMRRVADPIVLARVERFSEEIRAAAEETGLDPNLVAAIVYSESSGNSDAVSSADAVGLMQLLPEAVLDSAKRLEIEVPERQALFDDPALNLRLGASHFAWTLENEGGDLRRALVAYNAGRTKLRRWVRKAGSYEAWYAEQKRAGDSGVLAYADKVLDYTEVFRKRGKIAPRTRAAIDDLD